MESHVYKARPGGLHTTFRTLSKQKMPKYVLSRLKIALYRKLKLLHRPSHRRTCKLSSSYPLFFFLFISFLIANLSLKETP